MSFLHMCFSTILKKTTTWFIRKGTLVENEVPSLFYLNTLLVIKNYISKLILIIVCKGLPAPPLISHPPLDPAFPLFKICFLTSFLFDSLNCFTNISVYLTLWGIFRFIFRQLRMSLHKNIVAQKINFSSNA